MKKKPDKTQSIPFLALWQDNPVLPNVFVRLRWFLADSFLGQQSEIYIFIQFSFKILGATSVKLLLIFWANFQILLGKSIYIYVFF